MSRLESNAVANNIDSIRKNLNAPEKMQVVRKKSSTFEQRASINQVSARKTS